MGGLAFQILIIAPFLKSDNAPYEYLLKISDRFQKYISPLLLILIVTGGVNLGTRRAGHEEIPTGYISLFAYKALLVAVVISIHFFSFVRSKVDDPANPNHEAQLRSRFRFAKWTFSIGIIIIFIASMLRQWKF
jgi:putative copper export protein